ncbi:cytochrome P450 [Streptomyces sp. NPDC059477]|uniref:cytochrome P450 n=1 Tax=Streptomyces sp. NPDC059477 TaxID=3346847 RepID=UPI0036B916EA
MALPKDVPVYNRRDRFDPVPELAELRARCPVLRTELHAGPSSQVVGWLVTGIEESREVLSDMERFTTLPPADTEAQSRRLQNIGNLLHYDPPDHTRLRKMLNPEFTMRRLRRLQPRIDAVVEECLDTMEETGSPADLMQHFAWQIPGQTACDLLGVPQDDRAELSRQLDITRDDGRGRARQMAAGRAFRAYFQQLSVRERRDPGDDLLGMLVREFGDDITDEELEGLAASLTSAGIENVAAMLGLGILVLLEHPDQLALLLDRPELIDRAVEELLRYVSVIPTLSPRTALTDVPLGGQVVPKGERVVCSAFAANRTAAPGGPSKDGFDITREPAPHMAFGHGVHYCIGAPLARMQLRSAYLALWRRFPKLRLAVPHEEIRFRMPSSRNYSVDTLPVAW